MSNDTFLCTSANETKPLYGQCPLEGQLLMASVSIPVFWYMLFDGTSLTLGPTVDGSQEYLQLSTPTTEGLTRAEQRWETTSHVFGRQLKGLFQTWLGFVRDRAEAYIHCETAEWSWMFGSSDEFKDELETCLAAFEHIPQRECKGIALNEWWDRLLGQAAVVVDEQSRLEPHGNLSYCGYAWNAEVPWSEESRIVCGAMSDAVQMAPAFGESPRELTQYLERVYSPVYEARQVVCECGGEVFRLVFKGGEAGQRICVGCGSMRFFADSEEFWDEGEPEPWTCKECGEDRAQVVAGFSVDYSEQVVKYISLGQRCVSCGRLGCAAGWELWRDHSVMDEV